VAWNYATARSPLGGKKPKVSPVTRAAYDARFKRFGVPGMDALVAEMRAKVAERGLRISQMNGVIGRSKGGTFWIDGDPRLILRFRFWQWCIDPASVDLMPPKEIIFGELERKYERHGPNWALVTLTAADGDFPAQHAGLAKQLLEEFKATRPTTVHSLQPVPAPPSAPAPAGGLMPAFRPLTLTDVGNFTGRVHDEAPESTIGGQTTCIVCMAGPKSHLAVPCGHQLACERCTANMKICPYCRTPVQLWVMPRLV
jgi:hypothetical protein